MLTPRQCQTLLLSWSELTSAPSSSSHFILLRLLRLLELPTAVLPFREDLPFPVRLLLLWWRCSGDGTGVEGGCNWLLVLTCGAMWECGCGTTCGCGTMCGCGTVCGCGTIWGWGMSLLKSVSCSLVWCHLQASESELEVPILSSPSLFFRLLLLYVCSWFSAPDDNALKMLSVNKSNYNKILRLFS